jgi:demethylmenaquinone methyltransferase / 2-methoxy-6-polyprenyl-1,4-benzoquinol methylase
MDLTTRPDDTAERVPDQLHQDLFDRAASHYDLFNTILSFGADGWWRRTAARALDLPQDPKVIDVGTGTGISAIAIAKCHRDAVITATDVNRSMLTVAARKVARARLADRIRLVQVGGSVVPLPSAAFDGALLCFTIEDMMNQLADVSEIYRVLKPNARIVVLGLGGLPRDNLLRLLLTSCLRASGRVAGMVDPLGYAHVREDIAAYAGPDSVREVLERSGFSAYTCTRLGFGIVRLHTAVRAA